ncbi:MAG: isoaspartyl peptidase/L-asparaginase-like protein (Ntn-hydrolase superfamily) [Planctomycetota bacterium]|jgi:isoaspartyl peptidase/L-asparaginase-like protein (Ntn-hydrolase superfamily)
MRFSYTPTFLFGTAALLLSACAAPTASESIGEQVGLSAGPVMIATWPFGKTAVDVAFETLEAGGSGLDAVETGIRRIERLGSDGSVGLAGRPNAAGYAQLDACIMNGPDHGAGSVAGMEGIWHPITAARRVMENTKHVMLVGEGARWFALEQGLESVDVSDLPAKKAAWQARELDPAEPKDPGHDTVALLVLDVDGNLFGGCSTSGAGGKLPGRVGDSPILGSGLYVENGVGAAGATGIGENVMRYAASAMVVEFMRQGMDPQTACEEMIHRIAEHDPRGYDLSICFIALDVQGRVGAAASNSRFPFAVGTPEGSDIRNVPAVTPR